MAPQKLSLSHVKQISSCQHANMMAVSLKAVTEIAPLFTHKTVKIVVLIRYNYTAIHLRSIKNYM